MDYRAGLRDIIRTGNSDIYRQCIAELQKALVVSSMSDVIASANNGTWPEPPQEVMDLLVQCKKVSAIKAYREWLQSFGIDKQSFLPVSTSLSEILSFFRSRGWWGSRSMF